MRPGISRTRLTTTRAAPMTVALAALCAGCEDSWAGGDPRVTDFPPDVFILLLMSVGAAVAALAMLRAFKAGFIPPIRRLRGAPFSFSLLLIAAALSAPGAMAQSAPRAPASAPGRFDYYILALSWSPTYCADPRAAARDQAQCGGARRYAFVVHGLWPQNEIGWPQDCPTAVRDVPAALAQQQLDIMPSARLVQHQWSKHGSCSGLTPQAYFDLTRRLRASIATPPTFVAPDKPLLVSAADVRSRFVAANPKLRADGLAISCRDGRLHEVRICLTKAGALRACGRDVRDRCEGRVQMPPVRGAAASSARR